MELTSQQKALLRAVAKRYEDGCRSFMFRLSPGGVEIIASGTPGCPPFNVAATDSDFLVLERYGLVRVEWSFDPPWEFVLMASGVIRAKQIAESDTRPKDQKMQRPRPIEETESRTMTTVAMTGTPSSADRADIARRLGLTRPDDPVVRPPMPPMPKPKTLPTTAVFIGHGRTLDWMVLDRFLSKELKLDIVEFNSDPVAGYTTPERLQEMLDRASFAFLVMTAEDEHADGTKHARENVIHEIGLFQGKLGLRKAIVLLEQGCSEFSNFGGVTTIRFHKGHISGTFEEVRQTLRREGLIP